MPRQDSPIIVDGSMDFSGGVDSLKVTTLASQTAPNGLRRDQLAWMNNCTVRDGGISQRWGWQPLPRQMHAGGALYQGGFMYEPDVGMPYLMHLIGGILYRQDMTTGALTRVSNDPTLENPSTEPQAYFCQADIFLIIQAGDNVTLPLFWDGTTLRRSNGLTGITGITR